MFFEVFKEGIFVFRELHEARWQPFGLEGDLLLFFRNLKKSIDSKDINRIKKLISDNYYSKTYSNTNKFQLLSYFQYIFKTLPFFVNPSLEVEVCKAPESKNQQEVFLVIKPILNVHALGINFGSQGFGTSNRMGVLLERDKNSGLFSILNMEDIP
ncbi:hypothetical protein [Nostoc sp.]|uniref:hypothetical protein n=1 Tax=Nostoc sp. TaxID=1180 RepID=UPI002FFCB72C